MDLFDENNNRAKHKRHIWVIIIIISFLFFLTLSYYNVSSKFNQINANTYAYLIGGLIVYLIMSGVVSFVIFLVAKFIIRKKLSYLMLFSLLSSLQVLIITLNIIIGIPANKSSEYLKEGYKEYQVGNYDEALAVYKKALKLDSSNSDIYFKIGLVYKWLYQYHDAISYYNHAIELNSEFFEAHWEKGYAFNELGQFDDAIASYESAILLDPTDKLLKQATSTTYLNKAYECIISDDLKGAIISVNKAMIYNPKLKANIKTDSRFDKIRSNSEFVKLMN